MQLTLFYSPGACSLIPHIALEEAGAQFEARRVAIANGENLTPEFLAINPHARVPALVTEQGIVTENIAIDNYVADRFGGEGSVPRGDAYAAAKCNQLLGWFASSVHIGFAQLWRAGRFTLDEEAQKAVQAGGREALDRFFAEIEGMAGDGWLVGGMFTAADSYLLTFYRWGRRIGVDMSRYPRWTRHAERVLERPAVQRVLQREGLSEEEFRPPV